MGYINYTDRERERESSNFSLAYAIQPKSQEHFLSSATLFHILIK